MPNSNLFTENIIKEEPKPLYLHLKQTDLYDYAACGLITPDMYINSESKVDTTHECKDHLILSHGYINHFSQDDVLLEITLSEEELTLLEQLKHGDIYYYRKPFPITRINKIITATKEEQEVITRQNLIYDSGYIPLDRFDVFSEEKFKVYHCTPQSNKEDSKLYHDKITKFDKILGMYTFMRNTNFYYLDSDGVFANFSDNYFASISQWNNTIGTPQGDFLASISQDKAFFDFVNSNVTMDKEYIENLINTTSDQEIKEIFTDLLKNPTGKRKALRELRNKDGVYFYICLLYIHRHKDANKKDNFKFNISEDIPLERAEQSLAYLGLYYGYRILRASEEVQINNTLFTSIIGQKTNIKYELDTPLDYLTIESIYNYVFYDKKISDSLEYLSMPKSTKKLFTSPKGKAFKERYTVIDKEMIHGAPYIKIVQKPLIEIIGKRLGKYPEEITFKAYYITCFVDKYHPDLLQESKEKKGVKFFKRDEFVEKIQQERYAKQLNEILSILDLDGV